MKDRPELPEPQPDNPGDPEATQESSATVPCQVGDRLVHMPVRPLHHDRCHRHGSP